MDRICNRVWSLTRKQARGLLENIAGHSQQAFVFSLSGVAVTLIASVMLLDSSFNMRSEYFMEKFIKALMIF